MLQKLNSQKGSSMLMAILYLLVCLTAGAIVLSIAHANAGRMQRNEADQQRYLAVSSAIQMIAEEISGKTYTGSYREIYTSTYHPPVTDENGETISPSWTETHGPDYEISDCGLSSETMFLAEDLLKNIYLLQFAPTSLHPSGFHTSGVELPLSFSGSNGEDSLPNVSGPFRITAMRQSTDGLPVFSIYVTLSAQKGEEASYTTTMILPACYSESLESETVSSGNTTTTIDTSITTVTWGKPTITKGEAIS